MKTLQNNFTTPEQGNRLLELGVPTDSADCYITKNKDTSSDITEIRVLHRNYSNILAYYNELAQKEELYINIYPCWSVGRLMEIFDICYIGNCDDEWPKTTLMSVRCNSIINYLVGIYDIAVEENSLDFSKLEDQLCGNFSK